MSEVTVLDREMFTVREAARLLRVPTSTLRWWLEGSEKHRPVLRREPTGSANVTWGEFVEAGLLRQYRRVHRVRLDALRDFIGHARERLGVPYPLAHYRPYIGNGQNLVQEIQAEVQLHSDLCLVAVANGQLVLTPAAEAFVARVEWDRDVAAAWRPHDDPGSPVRMRPTQRFGLPAVRGISTHVLWEQVDAGADFQEVADDYDLSVDDVRWAWSYETGTRATAA